MILSVKEFVLTGKLGDIAIGSSKTDVLNYLGEPHTNTIHETGLAELFYNGIRFFYHATSEKVYAILCQDFNDAFIERPTSQIFNLTESISIDTHFFTLEEDVKYKDVINQLETENIKYTEESHKFWDKIIFESGVEFLFNNWNEYPEDEDYDVGELYMCGFRNFPVNSK